MQPSRGADTLAASWLCTTSAAGPPWPPRRGNRRTISPLISSAIPACRWTWTGCARCGSTAAPSSAAPRRCPTRRTVKKDWQAAWLLRAITCMDLTTLQGDDTPGTRAAPVRQGAPAGAPGPPGGARRRRACDLRVGAVCVYHSLVETAVEALAGSGIPVARRLHRLPRRPDSVRTSARRDPRIGRRRRRGDRHRHHARPRADRRLAGALRRGRAPSARPAARRT